jgi:subtilisin family serine protease
LNLLRSTIPININLKYSEKWRGFTMQMRALKFSVLLVCLSMLALAFTGQPVKADQMGATASTVKHNLVVSETGIYIVRLQDASLASYQGGISRLAATSPQVTGASRLDMRAPESQAYLEYLGQKQGELLENMARTFGRPIEVVFQYKNVLNAVAVRIDHSEALQAFNLPGVKTVYPDRINQLDTDIGPTLIGAPHIWSGDTESELGTYGEDIVIGVIDSGINHAHPSFADVGDDGYDHTNPNGTGNYFGYCIDNPTFCNDKLIGAYDLTYPGSGGPEDEAGHGSHTASTAGGNSVDLEIDDGAGGTFQVTISGVAPHANLIAYRVCDDGGGCQTSATVAAVDHAVADGVSVINYSISGADDPWNDAVDLAFLDAYAAGIFVSASAGNYGPDAGTVAKAGPWNAAVAASTHSRILAHHLDVITTDLALEDKIGLGAVEGSGPALAADFTDTIVYGGDIDAANIDGCDPWPTDAFDGAIGMVQRGDCTFVIKVDNLTAAGAVGALVYNNVGGPPTVMGGLEATTIPSMMISLNDGLDVVELIDGLTPADATMYVAQAFVYNDSWADILAGFSSRGPSQWEILKPDYTAPGVNILAAVATSGEDPVQFGFYQGTSMAAPHGAGSAALLMALHPDWSPAEVKSAIATTANPNLLKEDAVTPATPFDGGSGRIDLAAAAYAGIVLDETAANYLAANPYEGGEPNTLNQPSMVEYDCIGSCSWTRTFKSTLDSALTWTISFVEPPGMELDASITDSFNLPAGGTQSLVITADMSAGVVGEYYFGELVLTPPGGSGIATVRLPVVSYFEMSNLPSQVDIITDQLAGTKTLFNTQALVEIEDLYAEVAGMVKGTAHDLSLDQDPTNGDAFDDLSQVFWTPITVLPQSLRLVAEVVASEAPDVDLFVGTGSTPSADTIVCTSATGVWAEYCNIDNPKNGTWWVLVQNWQGSAEQPDAIKAVTAVVGSTDAGNLTVTGPVSVPAQELFDLDINWDEPSMAAGDMWYAQFNLGTRRSQTGNLGFTNVDLAYIGDFFQVGLSPATQDGYGDPGQVLDYTMTLSNQGNVADTYDISVSDSPWQVELEISSIQLEPYSSQDFLVSVTVPADALPGAMESVTVTATSAANPLLSADAVTNTYTNEVYDFDLAPAVGADIGIAGEVVTFTLTLTNLGNTEDTVNLTAADNLWDVNLPVTSFYLALGASVDVLVEVSIPADAMEGDVDLVTITATSEGGIIKTSELTTTVAFHKVWMPEISISE